MHSGLGLELLAEISDATGRLDSQLGNAARHREDCMYLVMSAVPFGVLFKP